MTSKKKSAEAEKFAEIETLIADKAELAEAFERGRLAQKAAHLITQMREASGLTKVELARQLEVSPPRISEAENPKGADGPTYRFMFEVAAACGFQWPTSIKDLRPMRSARPGARRQGRLATSGAKR